ncbi:MAG: lipopolysaccharide transport periplasmic protein LptA [Syntrophales bacterium]|nr:lipopolysaccharide transport periplasmic protein LptA [Syntrophales bacterium]
MTKKIFIVSIICVLFISYSGHYVQASEAKKKILPGSQPIEITADRLEAQDEKKIVIFTGNAVATQGGRIIKAESLLLYYKKEGKSGGKEGLQNMGTAGELVKIEARGQVSVSHGDQLVTGEQAVYYQDTQKIVVTGGAMMRQGDNVVHGDKIQVFLNENRGVVEAGENKRVKATIYPAEHKTTP